MGRIDLPQPVKITSVVDQSLSSLWNVTQFPLSLGKIEVAIALACQICLRWDIDTAASLRVDAFVLEETGHDDPDFTPGGILDHAQDKIIDYTSIADDWKALGTDAYAIRTERFYNSYKVFPFPKVLVRAPKFAVYDNQGKVTQAVAMIWYIKEEVTSEQLTKLLVKHHA